MKIWLDASDANSFTLSGSAVTAWNNKAGESFNFDQKSGDPSRLLPPIWAMSSISMEMTNSGPTTPLNPVNLPCYPWPDTLVAENGRLITSKDRNWLFGFHSNKRNQFYFEGWINNSGNYDTEWHLHAATSE